MTPEDFLDGISALLILLAIALVFIWLAGA